MIRRGICLVALTMISTLGWAQPGDPSQEEKGSLDGGSLQSQYDYLIDESNSFEEYKVIPKTWVAKFETNLRDSLKAQQEAKKTAADLARSQSLEISGLKKELALTQDSLKTTQSEKRNMAWLGVDMDKSSYRILMWSVIGALVLTLVVLTIMYRSSHAVTRDAKEKFEELDEEFMEYKKRSLEREQKLRRELQDEINKQKAQK